MSQIEQYQPPPNPTKITDTRAGDYIARFGATSWEVDALDPPVLNKLITEEIEQLLDLDKYNEWEEKEAEQISKIEKFIKTFKD